MVYDDNITKAKQYKNVFSFNFCRYLNAFLDYNLAKMYLYNIIGIDM